MKTSKNTHRCFPKNNSDNPIKIATDLTYATHFFVLQVRHKDRNQEVIGRRYISLCEYQFFNNAHMAESYSDYTQAPFPIGEVSIVKDLRRVNPGEPDIGYSPYYDEFKDRIPVGTEIFRMLNSGELK